MVVSSVRFCVKLLSVARSTLKPDWLLLLTVQVRLTWLLETAVAVRLLGAAGVVVTGIVVGLPYMCRPTVPSMAVTLKSCTSVMPAARSAPNTCGRSVRSGASMASSQALLAAP